MAFGVLISVQAHAKGNALLSACNKFDIVESKTRQLTRTEYFEVGQCLGVVTAVRETLRNLSPMLIPVLLVCMLGEGVSNRQAVQIAVKFLRGSPGMPREDEASLVMRAFHEAYPCPITTP